ncbi:cytochrome p450 [Apiospora saccharicola]
MLHDILYQWSVVATSTMVLGSLFAFWRLWMFTIKSWIWPREPKEVPYWIPFLGHTISFFRDYTATIENGYNSVGRTGEPFAIQLLGKQIYICTSPSDVSTVFDNTESFNFDNYLTHLLTSFGISKEALDLAWHQPKPGDWCYISNNPVNPKQKSLIHQVEDVYRTQLLPGNHMDVWSLRFLDSVRTSLSGLRSLDFCTLRSESCEGSQGAQLRAVSLYSLVSFVSVQATAHAMFGPHLHEINPLVVQDMLSFNEHVWMIVFRCPSILAMPVREHRDKLMATTRKFVRLPREQRSQASWAMTSVLDGMENVGMDMESRASMILMIFWAAVSNEHNSCFWLLTNLLYDDSLMRLAQSETESAWKSGQLDIKDLCANCPNLDSIFNEVLRLNNTAAAARVVSQKVILGGKELRPGSTVVMPFRQLHLAEDAWGADVSEFRPSRFLERKGLARSPSFRPFGGGQVYAPVGHLSDMRSLGLSLCSSGAFT